jgi:hypothetical protein
MSVSGNITEMEDLSIEDALKPPRVVGEYTTEERLERRKRLAMEGAFNDIAQRLKQSGYTLEEFKQWAAGKVDEPTTPEKMRAIRKERTKDVAPKPKPVADAAPKPEPVAPEPTVVDETESEQGNRRTAAASTRRTQQPFAAKSEAKVAYGKKE